MQKKVRTYINKNHMLNKGDVVVAAVSGGADSVCLLHLLVALREEYQIQVRGLHVHHGIRGSEADRDADYVRELCGKLGVPCLVVEKDVPGYAREQGLSLEEAARILRYEALQAEAERYPFSKIAAGHHSDDQAETILHNLFRGSGLKGLGGMAPVRDRIIRPLLCCSRAEILVYLAENGIEYCEDSTNRSEEYTRNKLRHTILPMITAEVNRGAVEHILHAGELVSQADAYLSKKAHCILEECGISEPGRIGMPVEALACREPILQTYLVMEMIGKIGGSRKDITAGHVAQVLELIDKKTGANTHLPYGLSGQRCYGQLWIEDRKIRTAVEHEEGTDRPKPVYALFSYEKHQEIPENQYTKWFDYDKIKGALSVRSRQTGDYITLKDGKRKTVKSYMIDEKIPRQQRDDITLLAEGSHILWIVGYRISESYKVTEDTKRVLQVKMDGGKNCGR